MNRERAWGEAGALAWAALSALAAAGCIGGHGAAVSKPIAEFPTPQALAALQASPVAEPRMNEGDVPTEGWTVDPADAAQTPDQAWQAEGEADAAFAAEQAQATSRRVTTRALSCTARQLARYLLRSKAPPPDRLQRFMASACGVFAAQVGFRWVEGQAPDRLTDGALLAEWRKLRSSSLLVEKIAAEATELGFAFQRANGRGMAVTAFAMPRARLTSSSFLPDAEGKVVVEGELAVAADYVFGYVNQGRFGVEPCDIDPSVQRPRFRATCRMAPGDGTAWLQLAFTPPRRVLGTPFVMMLARRTPAEPLVYREESDGPAHPIASAADFSRTVVERLNAVRATAGLRPVRLAVEQSATAARMSGHFFNAMLAADKGQEVDQITLGLLAGWNVGGMIRDGKFVANVVSHSRDAGRWLVSTLALPTGRAALLAPEIEEVALGPMLLSDPQGLGAIVTGYALHHGDDHAADVGRLYRRMIDARKRLSRDPPQRLAGMDDALRAQLARVHAGTLQPSEALQEALQAGVQRFSHSMRGWVLETMSLDALEIPEEIARQPRLDLAIGVTHHKPAGAAWAQLVILVVYADYKGDLYQEAGLPRSRALPPLLVARLAARPAGRREVTGARDQSSRRHAALEAVAGPVRRRDGGRVGDRPARHR